MSGQLGVCDGSASGIAGANKPHPHWPECKNWRPIEPPTEMTSLREIKDKLDKLALQSGNSYEDIKNGILGIKEQLRTLDAGLHETAMRNHQQIRALLDEHDSKFTEHFTALFDGNAAVVEKFNEFIDKIKQAAKPRKKARRRQER